MKGTVIRDQLDSKPLTVYLPPSWNDAGTALPLLCVQDGSFLFESSLELLEDKYACGLLDETVIVGVEPHNRLHEYTPWPAAALVPDRPDFGGEGAAYLSFLADRLVPYMKETYGTESESRGGKTGIIGSSLGGLIALYAAYTRPDTFSRIGLLSASFWYPGFVLYMEKKGGPINRLQLRVYMSVGSMEGTGKQTAQKDMVPLTGRAAAILAEGGLGPERLRYVTVPEAVHEDVYFIRQFPQALDWLYGRSSVREGAG